MDSINCQLKEGDSLRTFYLKRNKISNLGSKDKTKSEQAIENERRRKESQKKRELGYDNLTKSYSKNLNFIVPDSSIAVMKINDFSMGMYRKFYKNSFELLRTAKTQTLILDLRDNPGGKLAEIGNLYSYLVDTSFQFLDKAEVTSRTSLLHTNYFRGQPIVAKVILIAFLPIRFISMGLTIGKVKKGKDHKYYYSWYDSGWKQPKQNNFKGKVYVLINGGSFSASCILSSNLKARKRTVFVGEETGGTFNGTVAGFMPFFSLPNSKLKIRFGLALVKSPYKTDVEGRGIFPDIEIKPTIQDRINKKDVELNWVLDEINGKYLSN